MNKTENVSIGRQGFVCELDAYTLLQNYLKATAKNLADDPDRDEILEDLEAALASHLNEESKGLIINAKIAQKVIDQMGTVQASESPSSNEKKTASTQPSSFGERLSALFQAPIAKDHDREIIDGVCAGIARSLEVDPFWVRISFAIFTILTGGFGILMYILLIIIMNDASPKRSANEVVEGVKDKLSKGSASARKYEKGLARFFRAIAQIVKTVASVSLLAILFVIAIGWITTLFLMIANPARIGLFGENPGWLDFTLIGSLGLVLLIPIFTLTASLTKAQFVKSARFSLIATFSWILIALFSVGALTAVIPDVRSRLINEQPKSRNLYVDVVDGKIAHMCMSLWGDCTDNLPQIREKVLCDRTVSMIEPGQAYDLQSFSWQWSTQELAYPATEKSYCEFVRSTYDEFGRDKVVFVNAELNDSFQTVFVDEFGNRTYSEMPMQHMQASDPVRTEKVWFAPYFTRVP